MIWPVEIQAGPSIRFSWLEQTGALDIQGGAEFLEILGVDLIVVADMKGKALVLASDLAQA